MENTSYHMTPDEFRRQGKAMIDWIADYYEQVESLPVLSKVKPGDVRAALPAQPPQTGEPFEAMMRDVEQVIVPGLTHWQSPNFYAYFPANTSGPAILGELLSAGFGVQGMLWQTSPAVTELETHVLDWLVGMLDLPARFLSSSDGGGVIQDTASSAVLAAILAARERATGFSSNEWGVEANLRAYCSTQTHSSVEKAIGIVGIGRQNLRQIAVDENFAMRPEALAAQIKADIENGLRPFFVCATVGSTSSTAMDPIRAIGEICRANDIWLHVDGAMAGSAAICPEFRFMIDGMELADSFAFNPHKWMFTNFDCNCFFTADRASLIKALSILPAYLRNKATESGAVFDYRDWHIQLGRRFRALKLWFVIRHYGVEGLQYHLRQHVAYAQEFAEWVAADSDFELAAPAPLNMVCFRHKGGDDFNKALMDRLNADGNMYLTHTLLDNKFTLRMAIGATLTERRHVAAAWDLIREAARSQG